MSLVVLESNENQMTDDFRQVLKNADQYTLERLPKKTVAVVSWHQIAKVKPKSSPKRKSGAKTSVGQ